MEAEQLQLVAAIIGSGWLCIQAAKGLDSGGAPTDVVDGLTDVAVVLLWLAGVAAAVWASTLTVAAAVE